MKHLKITGFVVAAISLMFFIACTSVEGSSNITPDSEAADMNLHADDVEMVFVDGGTFRMGCTSEQGSDCKNWEKPEHSVNLNDFYIGKYEVTQAQWKAVMGEDNNPSALWKKALDKDKNSTANLIKDMLDADTNPSEFIGDDLPVQWVSWEEAQEFIAKLNEKTGKNYRLPTEAEWEYAARGGNRSMGYKYSGSDNVNEVAWYKENSGGVVHPVGTKMPNELGIFDMSGNAMEWVSDMAISYNVAGQKPPYLINSALNLVSFLTANYNTDLIRRLPKQGDNLYPFVRGGSHAVDATVTRVSYRALSGPGSFFIAPGFRLSRSPE